MNLTLGKYKKGKLKGRNHKTLAEYHNNDEKEILRLLKALKGPNYIAIPSKGKYCIYDATGYHFLEWGKARKENDKPLIDKRFLEIKIRTKYGCQFIRRDGTLLVDASKVDALCELGKEEKCECVLFQFLKDKNELTAIEICDNRGNINSKFKISNRKANKKTAIQGGQMNCSKVSKSVYTYSIKDTYRKILEIKQSISIC